MDIRYLLIKKEIFYRIEKLFKTINSYATQNDMLELRIFSAASLTNLKSMRTMPNGSYKSLIKNIYLKLKYFNLILKNENHVNSKSLIEITKQFNDLMMLAFDAHSNDEIFKSLVKRRVVVDRSFYYPKSLPECDKDWFKIIKNKLSSGVVHFSLFKVNKKPICSICYSELDNLENKNFSTIAYTLCGHTVCQNCDDKIKYSCPLCRSSIQIRTLLTINNNICAGLCCKPLSECESILLAECGHIYCTICLNDMILFLKLLLLA